jgi:hypothetical protein
VKGEYKAEYLTVASRLHSPEVFWNEEARRDFPCFAQFLPFCLPIPSTNIGMESGFSHATLVLGKRRHRLGDDMLSTLTILSYDKWSLADHFERR